MIKRKFKRNKVRDMFSYKINDLFNEQLKFSDKLFKQLLSYFVSIAFKETKDNKNLKKELDKDSKKAIDYAAISREKLIKKMNKLLYDEKSDVVSSSQFFYALLTDDGALEKMEKVTKKDPIPFLPGSLLMLMGPRLSIPPVWDDEVFIGVDEI